MASNYWAKLWIEMLDDRKAASLPDNLWRRFVECILIAKELNQNGRLPGIEDISWRLRVETETLIQELEALARRGLVDYRADNPLDAYWFIVNFEKRQSRMSGAERVSRYREAQMKRTYHEPCNNSVTECYIESEEETEVEEEAATPSLFSALMDAFCKSTGIPEILMTGKDAEAVKTWAKAEYQPAEVVAAVEQLIAKGFSISGPSSLNNALKIVRANASKVKQEQKINGRPLPEGI